MFSKKKYRRSRPKNRKHSRQVWHKQFTKYIITGIATNSLGLLIYIALTSLGLSPIMSISIFYPVSISLAFYLNKNWSFKHKGYYSLSMIKYISAYIICYILNVFALAFFSGYLNLPHIAVQAVAIIVAAGLLFLTQKYWIFRTSPSSSRKSRPR